MATEENEVTIQHPDGKSVNEAYLKMYRNFIAAGNTKIIVNHDVKERADGMILVCTTIRANDEDGRNAAVFLLTKEEFEKIGAELRGWGLPEDLQGKVEYEL